MFKIHCITYCGLLTKIIIILCNFGDINLILFHKNLAYNKSVKQSSTEGILFANYSVDGNYSQDHMFCAHGGREDNVLNWLMIDLLDEYYITQVILTPRAYTEVSKISERMDFVYIGISNLPTIIGKIEYPVYPLCRQSPFKADPTQNMSISCRPNTPPGRYVVVQQPTAQYGYLTICEIQVYGTNLNNTLGSNTCQGNYYGDKCDKYCNCNKGVKCDQQGICPNGCDANWEGEHCDKRTFNNSQLIGCFEFSDSSIHQFIRVNSQSCNVTCSGYGFTFAANMTPEVCICTNNMNWTKPCQTNCLSQSCHNVYSVCPNGTYGYDCTLKCNCLNNGRCSYIEGRCEDDCASGWTGASCDIRDCTKSNGGCLENEICISNLSDISSCQCKQGFNRTSVWLPCQGFPESTTSKPEELSNPKSDLNKSAIIGGVIGSIAGLSLIVALTILFVMRRKRTRMTESTSPLTREIYHQKENIAVADNPSTERKLKLQEFPEHLNKNKTTFAAEFQNLNRGEESHTKYSKEVSWKLNRFKNILPYQHNRVQLVRKPNEDQSDYINASYIQGIIKDVVIAAQGPVQSSVDDFWEMIWQQNIGIIIMLCSYVERKKVKCEQYLPEANNFTAGKYTIQNHKTIVWPPFRMKELRISAINGQQRSLIHLHFTEWPDHGVPNNVFYLLDFCRRCQKLYEKEKCGVLVHCSAGVGRTGCFLAIYDLLVKGYQGLDLSVPETVNNLRKQRMKMVEKQAQYNFIYEALAEEVKTGPTSFSKDEFTKFYNNSKEGGNERSHLIYQHKILSKCYSRTTNDESVTFVKAVTGEYNFCLVSNWSRITWKNIPDCQCMLVFDPRNENGFIPKVGQPIISGHVCISLVNETNSEWGKVFEVQKKGDNVSNYENVMVNAYENTNISIENIIKMCLIDKKEDYLDFLTFMELFSQLPKDANIAIILGNNHMLGYYFVAACNIISQLKVYDEVAILQNLCELCKITEYQPSRVSFEKLHQVVHEFILTSG